MQEIRWREAVTSPSWAHDKRAVPERLRRVAQGDVVLAHAMLTLAHYQEEHTRTTAVLLERETWVLTAILERAAPIWQCLPSPTLCFAPDATGTTHLELGHFSPLATVVAPRTVEPAAVTTTPRWARVSTCPEEQPAEQAEELVRTYVPISDAEAVATLGLGRILAQIELATRTAGQILVAQTQAQREREAQLWRAERMLGWESERPGSRPHGEGELTTRLAFALLGPLGLPALALLGPAGLLALGSGLWGLMVILFCFLFGFPEALLAFLVGGMGLLVCHWWNKRRLTGDVGH